ncbi:hypothetical protein QBC34DRAFT_374392 [Podospora aff. communis PSN243]|uniref:Uncharacterized protein n=1 Tax=Podospora aff. communis PSN243 TaxID=3040156 RepID=A0AAV9H495_9PEZI|nr:hypothetical protein QBC34DRAFT_374392 [Podospora aff. communis PSN243]
MATNHGGTELQLEHGQSSNEEDAVDDRDAKGEATKPRVITMDGMSLSFEFEDRPVIQSIERDDEVNDYVIAEDQDEDDICLVTRLDRPTLPATPRSSTPKVDPHEAKKDKEYDSDSTDSDDEEPAKPAKDEKPGAYFGRLSSDQRKTFLERLKQAGEDILWMLSPTDFKILTGYDRSCHTCYFVKGAKRLKPTTRFRNDLRRLWYFKVYPGLKHHLRRQARKKLSRDERTSRRKTRPPPNKPSPLRQSWLPSDLDGTKD